ncbi:DnaA ATPase domain-containing protein [Scopulibacillus darangshiensis]|uniref:DnaA ATPase domain-containing protein n=1 Tax=Scopulibacillus darangshiensis TaxID=442528 RepID=UPI001404798C|nr:DnaA/Hda family protein [Scopulibacillus darangshiensis]
MGQNYDNLWQRVLDIMEERISKPSFNTWLKTTTAVISGNHHIVVQADNDFSRDWLESRYASDIKKVIYDLTGLTYDISFVMKENAERPLNDIDKKEQFPLTKLNPKFTFDNFLVGSSNRYALSAAAAAALLPGRAYNPLYIYSKTGLGKTHLLHAIGNKIKGENPKAKIIYITAEGFANDFIESTAKGAISEFRAKYRHTDVLLFDDFEHLFGKEQTLDEFLHTFNSLYSDTKQIVITCDRRVEDFPPVKDKLLSRLNWGLSVDILSPDEDLLVKLIYFYCKTNDFTMSKEPYDIIRELDIQNVPELFSSLRKVEALLKAEEEQLTIEKRNLSQELTPVKTNDANQMNDLQQKISDLQARVEKLEKGILKQQTY